MDSCSFFATTFSSLVSFRTICASTKWWSSTLSSSNSSMRTKSINVTPSPIYSLTHQHRSLLCKNSVVDVPIVSMSWIIICANSIFSLYTFPSAHSEDDDECNGELIANGWIFNARFLSTLFNSSSIFVLPNNSTSSSCFCVCLLLCTSFSLVICYSFSVTLSALILLWTVKLWKHTQLPATNANYFQ